LNIHQEHLSPKQMRHPVVEQLSRAYLELNGEIANYLVRKLNLSPQAAEDSVQSAFESALRMGPDKLSEIKNARAFMYRSAYNAGVDYCRRAQVGQRHVDDASVDTQKYVESVDPFRHVSVKQELDVLVTALKNMPKKRRKLIMMNRVQGLSYAEISRQLSLSETVVRKHVNRALSDLLNVLRVRTGESRK
jgi:RNA polymerase sigma-70 factor (ECF subfamily)